MYFFEASLIIYRIFDASVFLYSFINLTFYLTFGKYILEFLDISNGAMKITGGLTLLKVSYTLIYNKEDTNNYSLITDDLIVYPLTTSLLSGPSTLSTLVILSYEIVNLKLYLLTLLSIIIILFLCLIGTILSIHFSSHMNIDKKIYMIINTMIGILLSSLSISFITDGIELLSD